MNTRQYTIDYLNRLIEGGQTRLNLDEESRLILRQWMIEAKHGKKPPVQAPAQATQPAQADQAAQPAALAQQEKSLLRLPEENEVAPPPRNPVLDNAIFHIVEGEAQERWQQFEQLLQHWKPALDLGSLRNILVMGEGNKAADIMMIGDAPTHKDEQARRPFAGEAGEKLNSILKAMGLERQDIYLTHAIKYRPAMPRQMTNNRPANEAEIELLFHVLKEEIALVRPKVIVALGVIAARSILQLGSIPLSEYQAEKRAYRGVPVIVTQHPSYLLRTKQMAERRAIWEDMLRVMEEAELEISAKQRGYFLPKP